MINVVCCKCLRRVYMKPGKVNGVSHSWCQPCLDEWCEKNNLAPIEISIPEGAIINHECFPKESACTDR
jgi:hypothetical protein